MSENTQVTIHSPAELRRVGSAKWGEIRRSDGRPTIGAWVAEMDFGTAPVVADALHDALNHGAYGYASTKLIKGLCAATATFQQERFGWNLSADTIRLASSVLDGLVETILHLTRPDSAVIVPTPAYMPFLTIPGNLGRRVIEVPSLPPPADGSFGWTLDYEAIEDAFRAGAGSIILCNPWNPTGRAFSTEELRRLQEIVSRYDALVFSDEIHSPLVFDGKPFTSYARLGEEFAAHTVTATAATKGWNLAAFPVAQLLLPDEDLRKRWDERSTQSVAHPSGLSLVASTTAYTAGNQWQREVMRLISANLDYLDEVLPGTGITYRRPEATYLTWWGFEENAFGTQSPELAIREKAGIAVNAGHSLGTGYDNWARINVATSLDTVKEVTDAIIALASS